MFLEALNNAMFLSAVSYFFWVRKVAQQGVHYGHFWPFLYKTSTVYYESGGHNIVQIQEI